MDTVSWYAVFALRRRASMSAIGSVIVMTFGHFLVVVSPVSGRRPSAGRGRPDRTESGRWALLPTALGHAGQFAAVRHLADAHPAQPELAVHGMRSPAAPAAGVAADFEL